MRCSAVPKHFQLPHTPPPPALLRFSRSAAGVGTARPKRSAADGGHGSKGRWAEESGGGRGGTEGGGDRAALGPSAALRRPFGHRRNGFGIAQRKRELRRGSGTPTAPWAAAAAQRDRPGILKSPGLEKPSEVIRRSRPPITTGRTPQLSGVQPPTPPPRLVGVRLTANWGTPAAQWGTPAAQWGTPRSSWGTPRSSMGYDLWLFGYAPQLNGVHRSSWGTPCSSMGYAPQLIGVPHSQPRYTPTAHRGTP
eukprot:XP_024999213.1 uncharacterized protein LOC112530282 [Gallus gallus]